MTYKNTIMLRQPEIESRANAWKAFMLPLHHWRVDLHTLYIIYILNTNININIIINKQGQS